MIREKSESIKEKPDPLEEFNKNFDQTVLQFTVNQGKDLDETHLRQTIIKLVSRTAATEQTTFDHAYIGICSLMQSGAYLKSVSNRKIIIGGKEFTKRALIYAAEQIDCRYTFRIIAKYLNKTIAKISYKYGIPGNLFARFKIENANVIANNTAEENLTLAIYCTDFQIENPDTPSIVREFLASREKTRKK